MSQVSNRSENYWNTKSESLKGITSNRSNGRRKSNTRRLSNGHVQGTYQPRSKLPILNSPRRPMDSTVRGGRYSIVPPVSPIVNGNIDSTQRTGRSAWSGAPVEQSQDGRVPQPHQPSNIPRVVDSTNYRNYLKKRYPRIAALEDEVRKMTPDPDRIAIPPPPKVKSQARPRMRKPTPKREPSPREVDRRYTLEAYTYLCEHSAFASQYVEDQIVKFLDEEIISDVLVDAIQESLNEKMFVSTTDLFTYWIENPMFSNEFVELLIDRTIEDEIIPDLLIKVISNARPSSRILPESAAIELYHELLRDVIPEAIQDLAINAVREQNTSHYVIQQTHYAEVYASSLLNEFVITACRSVVREVVIETADEERLNAIYFDTITSIFLSYMKRYGPPLVLEAYREACVEVFFEEEILGAVLYRDIEAVAMEVLTYYDTQLRRKDLEQIMNLGREKPVATIALDHCLSLISNQDAVRSFNEVLHKNLEGLSLESLFDRYDDIRTDFGFTYNNSALQRFHEKATLDVAVEVLADELTAHADEDLADLDFMEVRKNHIPRYVKDIDSTFYGNIRSEDA